MQQPEHVAVFWDFENLPPRSGVPGYETVEAIRSLAHDFGVIISFKAYLEVSSTLRLWSELQASGVALIDCPHRRTEAASKMLLVDMIAFAIDHPAPATIFLISGDRDFAYAVSTLRHRKYKVVVLCPSDAPSSLVAQADVHFDWNAKVLCERESDEPPLAPQRTRHLSTSLNGVVTSESDRKGKDRDINNEDYIDLGRRPHRDHQTYSYSDRRDHTGTLPNTTSPWRTPSRTTSRPYSPAGSFRSAQSAPQTPSPKHKSEPTFVTDGDIVFESSSQPDLREGFPFTENENTEPQITQSSASAPANAVSETPPLVPISLPIPSLGANTLWNSSTSAVGPVAAPVSPLANPVPMNTTTSTVPAPTAIASSTLTSNISKTKPKLSTSATLTQSSSPPVARPPPRPVAAGPAPSHFLPLIAAMQKRAQEQKQKRVLRGDLGTDLAKIRGLYAQAKVSKFASYMLLAEEGGIVTLGGTGSTSWVSLRPEWATSSRFPSHQP